MSRLIKKDPAYFDFIQDIKKRVQSAQIKAAVSVNQELLRLYWDMGAMIVEKQKQTTWGDGFLKQMSQDLRDDFPDMKGFSLRNLKYIRQWYLFWSDASIGQQAVAQIPWGHNLVILSKIRDHEEALFYVQKTIENNWSRAVLTHQIEGGFFKRKGKAVTNFKATLPAPQSDLAKQTLKDPYNFDFLTIREKHDEKELENALVEQIIKFLLELGAGFSFLGRQYRLNIEGDDFYPDLLFYHVRLHCYVVVELKAVNFKPEFAGKLNFFLSAVDSILKTGQDNPSVGILICKSRKKTVVEYALRDFNKPIGVSEYMITQNLPDKFKSAIPSIEEIEAELESLE